MATKGLSISTLRSHLSASLYLSRCPIRLLALKGSDHAPRKFSDVSGTTSSTSSSASYESALADSPSPAPRRRLLSEAWEKAAAVLTTVVAGATIPALALAWAVASVMAFFFTGWGVIAILRKQHTLSSPQLSLILVTVIALAIAGTLAMKDGLDRGPARPRYVGRVTIGALDAIKHSIGGLATKFQAAASAAELQRSQSEGSARVATAPSMTCKASAFGRHASASASLEALPMRKSPMAKLTRTKGTSSSAGSSASSNGGVAGPAGATPAGTPTPAPAGTTPSVAPGVTPSETAGTTPSEPTGTPSESPGETPTGSLDQTGGTPAH